MADQRPRVISRREVLRSVGAVGAAAAVGVGSASAATPTAAAPAPALPTAQPSSTASRVAYEHLTADEAELLEAVADQLIPADDHGPGAGEAQAVRYIDRALGGALSDAREAYKSGLSALDRYCRSSRGASFLKLSPRDQISTLIDVETGAATGAGAGFVGSSAAFFTMVRSHVLQGTFGDPCYGGNANYVGWDLIGYPGVRLVVSPEDQRRLEADELPPNHRSAYDSEQFNKASVRISTKEHGHGD